MQYVFSFSFSSVVSPLLLIPGLNCARGRGAPSPHGGGGETGGGWQDGRGSRTDRGRRSAGGRCHTVPPPAHAPHPTSPLPTPPPKTQLAASAPPSPAVAHCGSPLPPRGVSVWRVPPVRAPGSGGSRAPPNSSGGAPGGGREGSRGVLGWGRRSGVGEGATGDGPRGWPWQWTKKTTKKQPFSWPLCICARTPAPPHPRPPPAAAAVFAGGVHALRRWPDASHRATPPLTAPAGMPAAARFSSALRHPVLPSLSPSYDPHTISRPFLVCSRLHTLLAVRGSHDTVMVTLQPEAGPPPRSLDAPQAEEMSRQLAALAAEAPHS